MASTAIDKNFKKRKNGACMPAMEAEGQQYYRWARSWRRKKSARRSRIPSPAPPPPPPSPSSSSPSEETIYVKPSPWRRRLKIAVRSKPPEPEEAIKVPWPRELKVAVRSKIPEEEEEAAEYAVPSASPAMTGVSRCSGILIPVSSVGDNFSPPSPSHYPPSPSSSSSSSSSGSVTSPFYDNCL